MLDVLVSTIITDICRVLLAYKPRYLKVKRKLTFDKRIIIIKKFLPG